MDFRRKHIDLVGKMNLWFGISLALILVGLASWGLFGLNLGIDFKGGGQFQYRIPYSLRPQVGSEADFLGKARAALEAQGFKALPQIAGGDTLIIKTEAKGQSELTSQDTRVRRALTSIFAGGKNQDGQPAQLTSLGQQFVGPIIGDELKRNAITGVLLGVALIALWIYIRYNFAGDGTRYAVAGVAALVHDVLVLVGMFALIGHFFPQVEIDGAFIAALLTVVGYSINDSVVIFDRLRENLRLRRKEPFEKVVNDSLLETMSRSINTGLTVLIMLFVLLIRGGESIFNFVLAMLVGIASGLYSSIFNASMVLVAWHRWDEKKAAQARGLGDAPVSAPKLSTRLTTPNRAAASSAAAVSATTPAARRSSFATTKLPTAIATTPSVIMPEVTTSNVITPSATTPFVEDPSNETRVLESTPEISDTNTIFDSSAAPIAIDATMESSESSLDLPSSESDLVSEDESEEEAARRVMRAHPKARARRRF